MPFNRDLQLELRIYIGGIPTASEMPKNSKKGCSGTWNVAHLITIHFMDMMTTMQQQEPMQKILWIM